MSGLSRLKQIVPAIKMPTKRVYILARIAMLQLRTELPTRLYSLGMGNNPMADYKFIQHICTAFDEYVW